METGNDILNASELADLMGVSRATVTRWVAAGCPHLRVGQVLRFERQAVVDWMRERDKAA